MAPGAVAAAGGKGAGADAATGAGGDEMDGVVANDENADRGPPKTELG